jgi:hypothetical protein
MVYFVTTISFKYAAVGKKFISPKVHSYPVISLMNGIPRPSEKESLFHCFLSQRWCVRVQYAVTSSQKQETHRRDPCSPPSSKHSLGGYTVDMCTRAVSSSGCGSLEAIAQVGVPLKRPGTFFFVQYM